MDNKNQKLNFLGVISLLVGGMIGSAIFSMSGLTISYAGPSAIISWIMAALIQLFYGFAMIELATRYKKNGGLFYFPEMTFEGEKGEFFGYIATWGNTMADIISIAFAAMYVGRYLSFGFSLPDNMMIVLAIVSIFICFVLNTLNISTTSRINLVFACILASLLVIYSVIVIGSNSFSFDNFIPFFTQGINGNMGFIKSIPIAMIAYSSITSISYICNEIDNPKKTIPRAVITGLLIVMIVYILVLVATTGAMNTQELIDSNMVMIPLFAVCMIKLSELYILRQILSVAAVIALITTMLVVMAVSSRNIKAVSDKGLLPKIFGKLGKTKTPIYALLGISIAGIIMSFFPDMVETLINLGALFIVITIIINLLSLIYTRKWSKGSESHFIAPYNNIIAIVILIILICCYISNIISGGSKLIVFSLLWYSIGIVVYVANKREREMENGK